MTVTTTKRMAAGCVGMRVISASYATRLTNANNSTPFQPLERSATAALQRLDDSALSFVRATCSRTETRLELAALALLDMPTNKHWPSTTSTATTSSSDKNSSNNTVPLPAAEHLRVVLTAHLPADMDHLDQDVRLVFQPTRVVSQGGSDHAVLYLFESSQFLPAARGTSRAAKAWRRDRGLA